MRHYPLRTIIAMGGSRLSREELSQLDSRGGIL